MDDRPHTLSRPTGRPAFRRCRRSRRCSRQGKRAHGARRRGADRLFGGARRGSEEARLGALALLLLGFATFGVLVWEVNTQDLFARFARARHAPLLLWPTLIATVDGWAYSFTLPRGDAHRPPLLSLIMIRLAGESVNTLTPTAYLGGEAGADDAARSAESPSSTVSVVSRRPRSPSDRSCSCCSASC